MTYINWYSGEYLWWRVLISVIGLMFVILIFINIYRDLKPYFIRLFKYIKYVYYCFCYKKAIIVPVEIAQETDEPIINIAHQIQTVNVTVV